MRSPATPDLSSLARLAQNPGGELRPLLLRVHSQAFVTGPHRDDAATERFEALALGLIPLVPDDVLAEVQAMLRGRPGGAPPTVMAALSARLLRRGDAAPAGDDPAREPRDPTPERAFGRHELAALVDLASARPDLAAEVLARPEPSIFDRAALYRFADEEARDRIRRELRPGLAVSAATPAAAVTSQDAILDAAEAGDVPRLVAAIAAGLRLDPGWTCDLDDAAEAELFVLALLALGFSAPDCIRIVLGLGTRAARSVATVFRLAAVARSTPRDVAAYLVGYGSRARRPAATSPRARAARPATGRLREDGRADPVSAIRPDREGSARDTNARADRRSRATTGRDRT